jgi:DUF1365 family protein
MPDAYLITGQVMHERLRPIENRFVYRVFSLLCNVDRLGALDHWWFGVDRFHLIGMRSRDYGDGTPGPWMRRILGEAGLPADGEIWLLTFPRIFGFAFNPVSFWYCHNSHGELIAVLADVRNTFGERHRYLVSSAGHLPIQPNQPLLCKKIFHVSPFCEIDGNYEFRFRETKDTILVGIDYFDRDGLLLKTAIGGRRHQFSAASVLSALVRQPWLTVQIVVNIHTQALRLWLRRVKFFRKPPPPVQELSRSISEERRA